MQIVAVVQVIGILFWCMLPSKFVFVWNDVFCHLFTALCMASRVCFNLSLAIIFAPLLVKMYRVNAIFAKSDQLSREVKCVDFHHLQMLTWLAVAIQVRWYFPLKRVDDVITPTAFTATIANANVTIVCQMLSWWTKKLSHSINICDTVAKVVLLCSVYQSQSYESNLTLIAPFSTELAYLSTAGSADHLKNK